ncbi:MAG: response regulator transcription factor [bacterium]|nr:response regulator transcription factor [bacterium]
MKMEIRALVVDDEPLAQQLIGSLLIGDPVMKIVGFCSDGEQMIEAIENLQPDLVFLDVQMPKLSGIEALGQLEPTKIPYVILVTAHDRFAIQAFELNALDYLLKPFSRERFRTSLDKAKRAIFQRELSEMSRRITALADCCVRNGEVPAEKLQPDHILVREGSRVQAVLWKDIVKLVASNQYVKIHAANKIHLMSESLSSIERRLDPDNFFRIHRSVIVNASFIKEIHKIGNGAYQIMLSTGEELRMSRGRSELLPVLLRHCS